MSTSKIIFNFINEFSFKNLLARPFRNKNLTVIVISSSTKDNSQLPSHPIMKNYVEKFSKVDVHVEPGEGRKRQVPHNYIIPTQQRMTPALLRKVERRDSALVQARVHPSVQIAKKLEFAKTVMGNRIAFRTAQFSSASPELKKVLLDEIRAIQKDIFNIYKHPEQIDSVVTKHSYEFNKDRGIL